MDSRAVGRGDTDAPASAGPLPAAQLRLVTDRIQAHRDEASRLQEDGATREESLSATCGSVLELMDALRDAQSGGDADGLCEVIAKLGLLFTESQLHGLALRHEPVLTALLTEAVGGLRMAAGDTEHPAAVFASKTPKQRLIGAVAQGRLSRRVRFEPCLRSQNSTVLRVPLRARSRRSHGPSHSSSRRITCSSSSDDPGGDPDGDNSDGGLSDPPLIFAEGVSR